MSDEKIVNTLQDLTKDESAPGFVEGNSTYSVIC